MTDSQQTIARPKVWSSQSDRDEAPEEAAEEPPAA
jgi:hypothetical protein